MDKSFWDDLENGDAAWSHTAAVGVDSWQLSTDQAYSPTHAWYVPNANQITDTRLWNSTPVLLLANSTLSFWHQYKTEYDYDGAVIEISTDGGATWSDLGPYITANGYTGVLSSDYENPLGGRMAWTGNLIAWTEVTVDLSSFAGQSVNIRWRLGCDSSLGADGWYIDNVRIASPLPLAPVPDLYAVNPSIGSAADLPYQVTISGKGFSGTPSLRLGNTWLEDVVVLGADVLTATLPAGLLPGTYELTLINGDCQEAALTDAFTLIEGLPQTIFLPLLMR